MILLNVNLSHIYGFDDFHISFTYPRKLSVSLIGEETLEGRDRFRYKKAVVLMGTNATGKQASAGPCSRYSAPSRKQTRHCSATSVPGTLPPGSRWTS